MTPKDKKQLAELALLAAQDKCRTLNVIQGLLEAAENQCRNLQRCHSTWEGDPAIEKLRRDILDLSERVPVYHPSVLHVVASIDDGNYECFNGNDIWCLREADHKDRGIPIGRDLTGCTEDIPWEDPLDTYRRLIGQ